jgi:hypothetical protein
MVLYTWWCWHICKGEVVGVMELIWINLEKKRRRKEQVWVVRGTENVTKLVANAQPSLGVAPPFPVCTRPPSTKANDLSCSLIINIMDMCR